MGFPLIGFCMIRGVYCRLWDSSCGKKLLLSKVLVNKWIGGTTQQRPLSVQGAAWCGLRPRCSKHDKPNQGLANNFSSSFAALQLVLIAHIFSSSFVSRYSLGEIPENVSPNIRFISRQWQVKLLIADYCRRLFAQLGSGAFEESFIMHFYLRRKCATLKD